MRRKFQKDNSVCDKRETFARKIDGKNIKI
jgi:hypothetical protein